MTSVERARKFIQAKGKAIALTIVPLATLTVGATQEAKSAPILAFNAGSCAVSTVNAVQGGFANSNACNDTVVSGTQNGVSGAIKVTGDATVVPFASQGLEPAFNEQQVLPMGIVFTASGTTNSGSFSGLLPLNWDFNLTDTNSGASSGTYTLTFTFTGAGAPASIVESGNLVYSSCGSNVCASKTGSDVASFNGQVTGYTITLNATANSQFGFLSLDVPQNSIDVNAQQIPSGAPEPGSIVLGATGLLGLMFARFRRRKV